MVNRKFTLMQPFPQTAILIGGNDHEETEMEYIRFNCRFRSRFLYPLPCFMESKFMQHTIMKEMSTQPTSARLTPTLSAPNWIAALCATVAVPIRQEEKRRLLAVASGATTKRITGPTVHRRICSRHSIPMAWPTRTIGRPWDAPLPPCWQLKISIPMGTPMRIR